MASYLKWETYSGPISFEVQWNDIWIDNIQSFEMIWDTILVQKHWELELVTESQLGEVHMKPPFRAFAILQIDSANVSKLPTTTYRYY